MFGLEHEGPDAVKLQTPCRLFPQAAIKLEKLR
jgi:hypothetical protein